MINIKKLNIELANADPKTVVDYFANIFGSNMALATSLSVEDQVLTHIIAEINQTRPEAPVGIFTLDTGRLHPETYNLLDKTTLRYHTPIRVYFPKPENVEKYVAERGINGFYDSIESRHACCAARKLEPLARALAPLKAWICGLRKEQSITRKDMQLIEWDAQHSLLKLNPLINWTEQEVWQFIEANAIPFNPLQKKGLRSIGCQPCTRAISPTDDFRAGRWWWEDPENRECGLHVK